MAAPTPVSWTRGNGVKGLAYWNAAFTAGAPDAFTDTVLVDISALSPSPPMAVKINSFHAEINGNVKVVMEFDATADAVIYQMEGQTDVTHVIDQDFTIIGPQADTAKGGPVPNEAAAGFTGDVLLTTVGNADGDEITLTLEFEKVGDA